MMYRRCERCGASLDWGEKCDCGELHSHETHANSEKEEKKNVHTREAEPRARKAV